MRKTKRAVTLVAILMAFMGIAGAEEVGAPGMGIDMPDFGAPDFTDDVVGAPGMGIEMPDFGSDERIISHPPGNWTGWTVHTGWAGGYSGSENTPSYGLKLNLAAPGIITITNLGSDKVDIGSLKLVKVLEERPLRRSETLAYLPYTLILAPGTSTNVVLERNLTSGDKIILTNGLGIYAEMTVP